MLAPNSPLRAAVTAMAQDVAVVGIPMTAQVNAGADVGAGAADNAVASGSAGGAGGATVPEPPAKPKPRSPSHCLWAALIARIYEAFPLLCPNCGGQIRIIAFITFSTDIQKILEHIGVEPEAPRITPARGPPLWEGEGAQEMGEGVEALPDWAHWDTANQSPSDYPDDQRTAW